MARYAGAEISLAAGRVALLSKRGGEERDRGQRDHAEAVHSARPLLSERRYLTSAAAAKTKTITTSNQKSPMPHIIAEVMQFVIMVHLAWLACAVSSLGVRVPCLKHLNIITAHGRTSTMRSSPTEASQFQCRAKPKATAAPERRYSAKRYRTK